MDLLLENLTVSGIVLAVEMRPGQGTPTHRNRPAHGLVLNIGATSRYFFEGGPTLACHSGEMIYLPKASSYVARTDTKNASDDASVFAINFLTLPEQNENTPCVIRIKNPNRFLALFSRAASVWSRRSIGYYEQCMSDLYGIVRLLRADQAEYAPLERTRSKLAPALDYIHENYKTDAIEINHLARLCQISEPYLRRLFHAAFSVSPIEYIKDLRIRYATDLLRTREYGVTEVCYLSGFNDVSYFSREFRRIVGCAPSEYR